MSSSSDNLSLSSSRSSTRSNNMHIAMPSSPASFTPKPSYSSRTPYILASSPEPVQNPQNAAWAPFPDSYHGHSHHHIHIATPHPLAATTSFLDKHVPLFAKHHVEISTNHEFRAAKREARRSRVDSAIPEVDVEHLPHPPSNSVVAAAIHSATATGAGPALADSKAMDEAAWREVLASRQAARLRSGSDESRAMRNIEQIAEEGSDSDSQREYKGSPAVTP